MSVADMLAFSDLKLSFGSWSDWSMQPSSILRQPWGVQASVYNFQSHV